MVHGCTAYGAKGRNPLPTEPSLQRQVHLLVALGDHIRRQKLYSDPSYLQAALTASILPREISFKHSLQLWLLWSRQADTSDEKTLLVVCELMAQQRVAKRPGRIEPRAVKRRPKAYPLLTEPRPQAKEKVRLYGHPKKLK